MPIGPVFKCWTPISNVVPWPSLPAQIGVQSPIGIVAVLLAVGFWALTFPGFRKPVVTLILLSAYLPTYALGSWLGLNGLSGSSPGFVVLVLVGGVVSLFLTWSTLGHSKSIKDRLATIAMVGVGLLTAFFSGPPGGAGKFMAFLLDVLRLTPEVASGVNFCVRKGLHLGVYALLAIAAAQVAKSQDADWRHWPWAGFAWAVPHAVMDELTQSATSTRTGSVWDVALDISGMIVGVLLMAWFQRRRPQYRGPSRV